jgi:hypothetical protein
MEVYKVIGDIEELKWFWRYGIPPLEPHTAFFVSRAARSKTLDEEERKFYALSRAEMFAPQLIRHDSFEALVRALSRYECNKDGYTTKNDKHFPEKSLRTYWTITPIDCLEASKNIVQKINEMHYMLMDAAFKKSNDAISSVWYALKKTLDDMAIYAKSRSRGVWIDIDADISDMKNIEPAIEEIKAKINALIGIGNLMIIRTSGGLHWMVKIDSLKSAGKELKSDPIEAIIALIKSGLTDFEVDEVIRNSNMQIPMPGTFMLEDHIVDIINKEDFNGVTPYHEGE